MPEISTMKRGDLAGNLDTHMKEVADFAQQKDLSIAGALQRLSPPDKGEPADALLDCMARRGIRVMSDELGPASVVGDVIREDKGANFSLMISYFQEVYRKNVVGLPSSRQGVYAPKFDESDDTVEDFSFSVADMPRAWAPWDVGTLEQERRIRPRLALANILASRQFVRTNSWEVPIFTEQDEEADYLMPVSAGAPLPIITINVDEAQTKVHKVGYALQFPYEFFLNNRTTIQSIAFFQRWRAAKQEVALVNQALNLLLGTAGTTYTARTIANLNNEGVVDAHLSAAEDDICNLNVVVGNKESVIGYATVDLHFKDGLQNPLIAPARMTFLDSVVGRVLIARKDGSKISALGTTGKKLLLFDRSQCINMLIQTGGMVQETDRDTLSQTRLMTNSMIYAFRVMASSKNAAFLCSFTA